MNVCRRCWRYGVAIFISTADSGLERAVASARLCLRTGHAFWARRSTRSRHVNAALLSRVRLLLRWGFQAGAASDVARGSSR